MKLLKKLMVVFVALFMVMSLTNTVDAAKNDSITVTGTKEGEKLTIYRMLDLTVDNEETPTAYKYVVAEGWSDFFTTG